MGDERAGGLVGDAGSSSEIEALRVIVGERAQDARGHAGELAPLGDERQGRDQVAGAVRDQQAELAGVRASRASHSDAA